MAGFEPAPQGLEGPQAPVTPHSHLVRPTGIEPVPPRWQRGMHSSTPRPNVDRCRSPAHRHSSVVKDPARCERPRSETELPQHLARAFRASGQNKKALQGIALEGLVLKEYRAF